MLLELESFEYNSLSKYVFQIELYIIQNRNIEFSIELSKITS